MSAGSEEPAPTPSPKKPPKPKKATDPRVKEFIDWFSAAWQATHGTKYLVEGAKDGKLTKRMLETLSLDDLKARARKMMADDDQWVSENGRTIGILAVKLNKYAVEASDGLTDEQRFALRQREEGLAEYRKFKAEQKKTAVMPSGGEGG